MALGQDFVSQLDVALGRANQPEGAERFTISSPFQARYDEMTAAWSGVTSGRGDSRYTDDGPKGLMGMFGTVLSNDIVSGALNVLDMPRGFVTSAIKETYDTAYKGEDFSITDLYEQTVDPEKRIGAGDVIDTGNYWLDVALGFAGDVALDPLTYVSFGTAGVARRGSSGLAHLASEAGEAGILAKIAREGYTKLDDVEWQRLSQIAGEDLRGGARLNLGRTRVGQKIVEAFTFGHKSSVSFRLQPFNYLSKGGKYTPRAVALRGWSRARAGALSKKIFNGKIVSGDRRAARQMLRSSSDQEVLEGYRFFTASNAGRQIDGFVDDSLSTEYDAMRRARLADGIDGKTAARALDGNDEAIAAMGHHYTRLKEWVDALPGVVNETAGRQWLTKREQWMPKQITEEFADVLRQEGKGGDFRKAFTEEGFEKKAKIRAPESPDDEVYFMGERLFAQGDARAQGKGLNEQAWEIFVAREADHPGRAVQWFESDLDVSMPQYIKRLARRTGEQRTLSKLEEYGIAQSLFDIRPDVGLPEDRRAILSAWHALSETRRQLKIANEQLTDVAAREAENAPLAERAVAALNDVGSNPDVDAAAGEAARRFAGAAAVRQVREQATEVYNENLARMADKLDELEASLAATKGGMNEALVRRGEILADMADMKARITQELVDSGVARQMGRNAPSPSGVPGTAIAGVSRRAHELESQLSALEDEALELRREMASFGEEPTRMVEDIRVREQTAARAERHVELLDQLDDVNARIAAGDGATNLNERRKLAISAELTNNSSARVLRDVAEDVGDGSRRVTREQAKRVAEVAREESRLMRSWIAATDGESPFGFNVSRAQGQEARALLGVDDRLTTLSDLQRKMADELAAVHQAGGSAASTPFYLSRNMPEVDPDGYVQLRGPDGQITNVWWAGSPEPLDFSTGIPQPTSGAADGFLGLRATHSPRQAAGFGDETHTLTPTSVASQNPKVYATEEITSPFGDAADRSFDTRGGFGSGRGAAQTAMQNDMFVDGWKGGVLSPQKLAQGARHNGTGKLVPEYAKVGRWKRFNEAMKTVDPNDRNSVASAFYEAFGDMFSGRMSRRMDNVSRETWVMNRVIDDAFGDMGFATAKHKADAADAFKTNLKANGHDGILFNDRQGNWNVIATDYDQIESARHIEWDEIDNATVFGNMDRVKFARTLRDMETEAAQRVVESNKSVAKQMRESFGSEILRHMNADVRARRALVEEIQDQQAALIDEIASVKRTKRAAQSKLRSRERRVLDHAERLMDDANNLREQHARLTEQWAKGLIDEATLLERDGLMARARVAELEALSTVQEKALEEAYGGADVLAQRLGKTIENTPEAERIMKVQMMQGYRKVAEDLAVPGWVDQALHDQGKMITPKPDSSIKNVVRTFDWLTQSFKAWAVTSPGFHARNLLGGLFNNSLANVDASNYASFHKAYRVYFNALRGNRGVRGRIRGAVGLADDPQTAAEALAKATAVLKHPEQQRAFAEVVQMGLATHGQFTEIHTVVRGQGNLNPFSPGNKLVQGNRRAGMGVENFLRGSLAYDRMLKAHRTVEGALDPDLAMQAARNAAVEDIMKFHFDYDDLSAMEAGVARRIIPFYTWTRKNFPLQVEMMLTHPQKYTRFLKLKQNMEIGQEEEGLIPSYIRDQLHIKLPFDQGGDSIYWMPDLPFRELTRTIDPKRGWGASTNPILRAPFEAFVMDKKFFTDRQVNYGYQPLPQPMQTFVDLPVVQQTLQGLGILDVDENGRGLMDTRYQHVLADSIPVWGRVRRLFPSDEYYDQQVTESWANFMFGAGLQQITESERQLAARGR